MLQCIGLCLVTSVVLGALPALRFSRPSIITALRNDSAGGGQRVGRLQRFTAAAQAGLAVPFLVICGVYLDQARVTTFADVGFTPRGLYAARITLPAIAKTTEEQRLFVRTVLDNLATAPGVASVSVGDGIPLDFINRDVRVARDGEGAFVMAHTTRIGPGTWTPSARACSPGARSMPTIARRRARRAAVGTAGASALPGRRPDRRPRRLCAPR